VPRCLSVAYAPLYDSITARYFPDPWHYLPATVMDRCCDFAARFTGEVAGGKMTDGTNNDRVRMTVVEARALGEAAMRGAGYDEDDARILTDHVLDAALCGYEYSGLPKLLNVIDAPDFRLPRWPVMVVRERGPTAMLDGGNNTGMIAAYRAAEATIKRAQANGLTIVCLANTWMTGRSAYYCEMIARADLIVIHSVAAPPMVAPFGGVRPALGTNPIAFGFPTAGDPLVIDMGTSAFMGTDLQYRARLGTPIPEGVALGPDGRPTTDAAAAQKGALLRFGGAEGGYKGFGLALAMDALGALTAGMRPAFILRTGSRDIGRGRGRPRRLLGQAVSEFG
jgi:LDH2 family malate/lactate/ureidoglycolate dehydrogenase